MQRFKNSSRKISFHFTSSPRSIDALKYPSRQFPVLCLELSIERRVENGGYVEVVCSRLISACIASQMRLRLRLLLLGLEASRRVTLNDQEQSAVRVLASLIGMGEVLASLDRQTPFSLYIKEEFFLSPS